MSADQQPASQPPAPRRPIGREGRGMTESFKELEDLYRATLNRMSTAYQVLRDVMGE
jgi:hypothetical protein